MGTAPLAGQVDCLELLGSVSVRLVQPGGLSYRLAGRLTGDRADGVGAESRAEGAVRSGHEFIVLLCLLEGGAGVDFGEVALESVLVPVFHSYPILCFLILGYVVASSHQLEDVVDEAVF